MGERPSLLWRTEPGALYTVMMVDEGIERLEGKQYIHWLVENVPGTMVGQTVSRHHHHDPPRYTLGTR